MSARDNKSLTIYRGGPVTRVGRIEGIQNQLQGGHTALGRVKRFFHAAALKYHACGQALNGCTRPFEQACQVLVTDFAALNISPFKKAAIGATIGGLGCAAGAYIASPVVGAVAGMKLFPDHPIIGFVAGAVVGFYASHFMVPVAAVGGAVAGAYYGWNLGKPKAAPKAPKPDKADKKGESQPSAGKRPMRRLAFG